MLEIHNLTVYYGRHPALQSVSLALRPGEIAAVIGPNGAGKSTLVKAISGAVPVRAGRLTLDGRPLESLSGPERARRIAVVPQGGHLPPAFTVEQTVLLGRTPYLGWLGRAGPGDLEAVETALAETGLTGLRERVVSELSGGEHQRVLLARALAARAPILLLDEPAAHLDLAHQAAIFRQVTRLSSEKDLAVLMVMHDLNQAAAYADRILLLAAGEIRADGTPEEVLTRVNLADAYGVNVQIVPHPLRKIPLVLLE
ncbi:MAG TPA: ABC transporter ATP-binding protein [Anaerolineales bacterium]|nr:ABC transporter ATP-binding protein [Anaerolineales bacterium]